jgi:DNA polymerase III delta prime subunit
MSDTFITNIKIIKVRDVVGLEIPLSATERQHLILTGRNGCGKTSFLLALNKLLDNLFSSSSNYWEQFNLISPDSGKNLLLLVNDVEIDFNHDYNLIKKLKDGAFIFASFDSKRQVRIEIPSGIKKT